MTVCQSLPQRINGGPMMSKSVKFVGIPGSPAGSQAGHHILPSPNEFWFWELVKREVGKILEGFSNGPRQDFIIRKEFGIGRIYNLEYLKLMLKLVTQPTLFQIVIKIKLEEIQINLSKFWPQKWHFFYFTTSQWWIYLNWFNGTF